MFFVVSVSYLTLRLLSGKAPEKPRCKEASVNRGELTIRITGRGIVRSKQLIRLYASRSGQMEGILVKKGDKVSEGQRLIKIKPEPSFALEVNDIRYRILNARMKKEAIEKNLARQRKLYKEGLIALVKIEELEKEYLQSSREENIALERMRILEEETGRKISENLNEKRLSKPIYIYVIAPFSGTVLEINKDIGDYVIKNRQIQDGARKDSIIIIADLSEIYVDFKVNEVDIEKIRADQPAEIRLESYPTSSYDGYVQKVSSIASAEKRSDNRGGTALNFFTTTIKLNNPDAKMNPGMTCDVSITTEEKKDVLHIPVEALVKEDNQRFVYITNDNTIDRKPVTTGIANEYSVEIINGLNQNSQICTNPLVFLEWQELIHRYQQMNFFEKLLE
jgi:RND family efflux transporter MFP subunit